MLSLSMDWLLRLRFPRDVISANEKRRAQTHEEIPASLRVPNGPPPHPPVELRDAQANCVGLSFGLVCYV